MHIQKILLSFTVSLLIFSSLLFGNSEELKSEKIVRVVKELGFENPADIRIKRLGGGQTNDNYKVSVGSSSYFFRCSNESNTALGCSLEREWQITSLLGEEGFTPKVILYSPQENVLVTDFILAKPEKLHMRDKEVMDKFCRLISSVHNLSISFPTQVCPFDIINKYVEESRLLGIKLPAVFTDSIMPKIISIKDMQPFLAFLSVPCHLDLHAGNLLDDGHQLWLIDWEYGAMSHPFFDLATLASVENFSDCEMGELLECYLNRCPTQEEFFSFCCMRILADARWALWSFLQMKLSLLDEPFEEMGNAWFQNSWERIKRILE